MKWKLANGGLVTCAKQPTKKDFNKLIVDYIEGDELSLIDWSIKILNPSSNLIKKCHNGELYISLTPVGRSGSQAFLRHLPDNYYKIEDELVNGLNDISDSFEIIDFKRDAVRGDTSDGEGFGHKVILNRLINPSDYDDYFDYSWNGREYCHVDHNSSSKWHTHTKDQITVCLWKGPYRKHLRKLTEEITVDVDKDY